MNPAADCLAFGGTRGPLGCMSETALLKIQRTSVASLAALRLSDRSWIAKTDLCPFSLTEPSVCPGPEFRCVSSHCLSVECGSYVDGERISDGSGVLASCLALIYCHKRGWGSHSALSFIQSSKMAVKLLISKRELCEDQDYE